MKKIERINVIMRYKISKVFFKYCHSSKCSEPTFRGIEDHF